MPAPLDLTGHRFGRLVALHLAEARGGRRVWRCRCDCGNFLNARTANLRGRNSTSCGCLKLELFKKNAIDRRTHGDSRARLYHVWASMIARCEDPNATYYSHYGAIGIKVCREWRSSYETFRDWALRNGYRDDLTIDRINNSGNYEPGNCRFATRKVQARNRRYNRIIEHDGMALTLAEWSERTGIHPITLIQRIERGWPTTRAFTEPPRKRGA